MSISKKHYEYFSRFFEKPTRESLRELLKNIIGETDYLDFKEDWPKLNKIAKHVLAFANSGGGALIFGVKETKDGTLEPVGIPKILDKSDIFKKINNYIPTEVIWDVYDFNYKDSEYPAIKGKIFQVMLVEYDIQLLPILSLKECVGEIKDRTVYVRRGTNTDEATHEELQKIINKRIETGYSSTHLLSLSGHLEQLKILYRAIGSRLFAGYNQMMAVHEGTDVFLTFVKDLIKRKKRRIEEVLDLLK